MNSDQLPNAPACERNRDPILKQLAPYLKQAAKRASKTLRVLEIGSGTGQHAAYFSQYLEQQQLNIDWQPSDTQQQIATIDAWRRAEGGARCLEPIVVDLAVSGWNIDTCDFVFTANTLHIVAWPLVEAFFQGVSSVLQDDGLLFVYGPFNYGGQYSSESNRQFDQWLKDRDPVSGIRDIEAIQQLALQTEPLLQLTEDIAMPANNRLLVFASRR